MVNTETMPGSPSSFRDWRSSWFNRAVLFRRSSSRREWGTVVLVAWCALAVVPFLLAQDTHRKFVWTKNSSRGSLESYGVDLNENGTGRFYFKKREQEQVELPLTLKSAAIEALVVLFVKADFLNESKEFASPRKVADMGEKTVRFQSGSQSREVVYNYTEDRVMQEITNFFENLCQQERSLFEIDLALKYDRLGIPKKLDELDRNLSARRIVAPERFAPLLERIYQDQSLMNLARKEAKKLLSRIEKMQTVGNKPGA